MFGPMPNPALSGDSMSLSRAVLRERLGQQIAVADFGRIALVESDLKVVLDAAVSCCARSLGAEFAKVLRYVPERKEIGRAHVCTPVTNAHLICRLLLD